MKLTRSKLKQMIREDAAFTKKYDNNRKLKGKQSDLPDALQKAIISVKDKDSDTKIEESESFKPHNMFNPKTGKSILANTYNRHLELAELGFVHEKTTVKESKMKITKTQLRQIIRESMYPDQYSSKDSAIQDFPPEAFGFGPDSLKAGIIDIAAKFYSISPEELTSALEPVLEIHRQALDPTKDLSHENISEILNNTVAQARQAMPFDERRGAGKEARIGKYILQILRNIEAKRLEAEAKSSNNLGSKIYNESKMKITKTQLKQIIKEERAKLLNEMSNDAHEDWRRANRENPPPPPTDHELIERKALDIKQKIYMPQYKEDISPEALKYIEQFVNILLNPPVSMQAIKSATADLKNIMDDRQHLRSYGVRDNIDQLMQMLDAAIGWLK
jgi:hypothetical protein